MSSSAPGISGATVTTRSPSRCGLEVLVAQVRRGSQQGRVVRTALRMRQPRPLEVRAEGLRTVGRGDRHPVVDLVDEPVQVVERRRDPGRQERGHAMAQQVPRHPVERRAAAHRVVAAPAVHVDVDEAGRDERGAGGGVGGPVSTPTMTSSSTVIVPSSTESSRTRRPLIVVVMARPPGRRAPRPAPRRRTARRARSGPPGRRDPVASIRRPCPSTMTRCSTSRGSPVRIPRRRASSAVAAAAAIVPVPRRNTNPARARVSCRDPWARSAVMTASAQSRTSTADSIAMGSSSANRSRRRCTTGWRAGMPRLAASSSVDGRMTRVEHPRRRHPAATEHLLGERHQPVRPGGGPAVRPRSCHDRAAGR